MASGSATPVQQVSKLGHEADRWQRDRMKTCKGIDSIASVSPCDKFCHRGAGRVNSASNLPGKIVSRQILDQEKSITGVTGTVAVLGTLPIWRPTRRTVDADEKTDGARIYAGSWCCAVLNGYSQRPYPRGTQPSLTRCISAQFPSPPPRSLTAGRKRGTGTHHPHVTGYGLQEKKTFNSLSIRHTEVAWGPEAA